MFDLKEVQRALDAFGIDAWLFYDFHGSNPLARRILGQDAAAMHTRRWFYLVPAKSEPRKLVHRIEQAALDHLPGSKELYLPWQELEAGVGNLVAGSKRVAMEFSPRNAIPYVAKVDAGTVDLVRSFGVDVISSGDLIQQFEATLDDDQLQSHREAEKRVLAAYDLAVHTITERVKQGNPPQETAIQSEIMAYFEKNNLFTEHAPIVAVGTHSGDPHYAPSPLADSKIDNGDLVMIDLWCKLQKPKAVFADYTKMLFVGESVPQKYADVFNAVATARDAAVALVRDAFASGRPVHGWEVDDAARRVIDDAGYGEYFIHRTGHNISEDLHGNGTHMDNLETRDDRLILRRTCFSVEPGIYMDEFGIRSEVNVLVDRDGHVHVTGEPQAAISTIL